VEPESSPSLEKDSPAREAPRLDAPAELHVVGLSHRSAPLELREKFAVATGEQLEAHKRVVLAAGAREAVLLSTCNRVELYACASPAAMARFFAETAGRPLAEVEPILYRHEGAEAVRHLFRVTASLDSLVLGEDQILNQVKAAYDAAQQAGTVGEALHAVFQAAIKTGKRVRRETRIGERMLSVSSVAVDFVQKVFSDLSTRSVLLVGAGEAARLTLVHLRARGVASVRIANRSLENARKLAEELGGEALSMDSLPAELARADIVLTSVGAGQPIVTAAMVQKALKARRGRSLFFLDIAVPRDVEPAVEKLSGVFVYNLDDLQAIVRENYGKRHEDLDAALHVVGDELERYMGRERHRRLGPLVAAVVERMEQTTAEEVKATLDRLASLSPEARAEIEKLGERLVKKLLHAPLTAIRDEARSSDDDGPQRLLERLLANLPPSRFRGGRP
jgi:glutamyl-tRNA reductase